MSGRAAAGGGRRALIFRVDRFPDKPDPETAVQMVESGVCSWNSGMFAWRVDRILAEFDQHMPEFYCQLAEVEATLDMPHYLATLERVLPAVARQTIDYGVMEGAQDVVVIPVDIGWSDVGSWSSGLDLLPVDGEGNVVRGPYVGIDTCDTLILGRERLIAIIGVQGLAVVSAGDALLIYAREREQQEREVIERLRRDAGKRWL